MLILLKLSAIAENIYGCLKEYNTSLFLTLGTGIGGAVFLNNTLLEEKRRPGYEFGHMVIQKNGIQCNCGRKGCFEKYASMKAEQIRIDDEIYEKEVKLKHFIRELKVGN